MDEAQLLDDWVRVYAPKLLDRALYVLADKQLAMDMVQEVFIVAYKQRETFRAQSSSLTWLQGILRHKIADYYRKKYRFPFTYHHTAYFDADGHWADHSVLADWQIHADTADESVQHIHDALAVCIERLPHSMRIVIRSYYLEQEKSEQICQDFAISPTNLWKILQRARMQIRACMEKMID